MWMPILRTLIIIIIIITYYYYYYYLLLHHGPLRQIGISVGKHLRELLAQSYEHGRIGASISQTDRLDKYLRVV